MDSFVDVEMATLRFVKEVLSGGGVVGVCGVSGVAKHIRSCLPKLEE